MSARRLLRYARRAAGLSQRELARRSGIAQPAISRIESGRAVPRVDSLGRLLEACGLRLDIRPLGGEGIDRSAIRELVALTPAERLQLATVEGRRILDLDRVTGG